MRDAQIGWILLLAALLALPPGLEGQATEGGEEESFFPRHGFLVTGYGSAGYSATFAADGTPNDFKASLAPVLLWQISDRFLFEAELEFGLEEGVTETELEYAQIDYSLSENFKLVAGKFLLPFNVFTERLHPTWINSFVSPPPVYGGHHGGTGPVEPLLPVLTDVGVQVQGTFDVGSFGYLTTSGFVTQGPRAEAEEEPGGEEAGHAAPEVVFGSNFEDNNEGKMIGGRVGGGFAPYFEVNVSAMSGNYDDAGDLRLTAYGAHAEGRYAGVELHGEWIRTEQDVPEEAETLDRDAYWLQLSYEHRQWQPQIRWGQLLESRFDGEVAHEDGQQVALGLAYWLEASLGVKAEYIFNSEDTDLDNDRFALQWAFGF